MCSHVPPYLSLGLTWIINEMYMLKLIINEFKMLWSIINEVNRLKLIIYEVYKVLEMLGAGDEDEVAGLSADVLSKRNKGSKVNAFL